IAIRGVTDSRSRQFDGGTAAAEVETHLDEHTRTQPVALVGQGRLDLHVASVLVNERVNSRDVTVENVAGQFGGADPHRATVLNLRPLLLGNTEIDVNGVKRLQGHDGRACRQVLAKIHLTNPEDAGKWRTNRLALNRCPQLGDISLGLSLVGTGLVIIRLRDDPLAGQLLSAAVVQLREIALGFHRSQLGALLPGVQLDQNVPLVNKLPGLELNLGDGSRKVGAHRDALNRLNGSDRGHRGGPLFRFRNNGGHCLRGHLKGRCRLNSRLNLPKLKETKTAKQDEYDAQHQQHSLRHTVVPYENPLNCS